MLAWNIGTRFVEEMAFHLSLNWALKSEEDFNKQRWNDRGKE